MVSIQAGGRDIPVSYYPSSVTFGWAWQGLGGAGRGGGFEDSCPPLCCEVQGLESTDLSAEGASAGFAPAGFAGGGA